jgi:hypothetical protein
MLYVVKKIQYKKLKFLMFIIILFIKIKTCLGVCYKVTITIAINVAERLGKMKLNVLIKNNNSVSKNVNV